MDISSKLHALQIANIYNKGFHLREKGFLTKGDT